MRSVFNQRYYTSRIAHRESKSQWIHTHTREETKMPSIETFHGFLLIVDLQSLRLLFVKRLGPLIAASITKSTLSVCEMKQNYDIQAI